MIERFKVEFAERFELALKRSGKKQVDITNDLGIASGVISTWKKRGSIGKKHLAEVSTFLGIDVDYLLGYENSRTPVSRVPIIGTTSCGSADINHLQEENLSCNYNGDYWREYLYCVVANGDSMYPDIEDGDEIICDPQAEVGSGDIVHYTIDGEDAVKVLSINDDAGIIELVPHNQSDEFKTRIIKIGSDEHKRLDMSLVVTVNRIKFRNRAARLRMIGRA